MGFEGSSVEARLPDLCDAPHARVIIEDEEIADPSTGLHPPVTGRAASRLLYDEPC
jgi:hypothetical protein